MISMVCLITTMITSILLICVDLASLREMTATHIAAISSQGQNWLDSDIAAFTRDNAARKQLIKDSCVKLAQRNYLFQHFPGTFSFMTEPKRKFLWCYSPKIGTKTWMDIFVVMYNISKFIEHPHFLMWDLEPKAITKEEKGYAIATLKYEFADREWHSMMATRHPLDRLQSAYQDKIVTHQAEIRNLNGSGVMAAPTYEDFLTDIVKKPPQNQNDHWKPNWHICNPCLYHYDYILKMETYDRDTRAVNKQLGLIAANYTVGHRNLNNSTEKMKIKSNNKEEIRIKSIENLEVDVLSKLYEMYLPDFILFGYDPRPLEDLIRKKMNKNEVYNFWGNQ